MKRFRVLLLLLCICHSVFSQEVHNNGKRGTIKVRKTGQLIKVEFDNVNYRLIGIDRFGNVLDTAVVEFQMSVTIQGKFFNERGIGPGLSDQMHLLMEKCEVGDILYFKNIKAKDKNGVLMDAPKFQYIIGNSGVFKELH